MKKSLAIILAAATFYSSAAFAKTEGNYFGINILHVSASHKYRVADLTDSSRGKFDDSAIGFGASYKHAFNFGKTFLAPELFFDKLGTVARDNTNEASAAEQPSSMELQYRYGAKLNLGYDLEDNLAAYVTAGAANVGFQYNSEAAASGTNGLKSNSTFGYLYGLGVTYKANKDVGLNLEYNKQTIESKISNAGNGTNHLRSNIGVFKVGAVFAF